MRSERLGYGMNLFPSETTDEVLQALDQTLVPVRQRVSPDEPLGVELRFGMPAIRELSDDAGALADLRGRLDQLGFRCFTLNGFPISEFHGERVKEDVFRPTWLDEERVEATSRLGRIAAGLLPEGDAGTVSTLTGSFKAWGHDEEARDAMARNLSRAALDFSRLRDESGRTIRLALEPEPLNTVENTSEVLELWDRLERVGVEEIVKRAGESPERAREILAAHLALNYDTCHFSLQFEEPESSLRAMRDHGVPIGKLHLSNCLAVSDPATNAEGMEFLAALDEPRYLHQVLGIGRDGSEVCLRDRDVPEFLARDRSELEALSEVRVHFHLPLFFEGGGGVRSTHEETRRAYRFARAEGLTREYVIETYTFAILMERALLEGVANLEDGIAREFEWVHNAR